MKFSMAICKEPSFPHLMDMIPSRIIDMKNFNRPDRTNDKVMFVMGATATGKSQLSINLASHFPSEIINADKIQLHDGLDIVTNKITEEEQNGVRHHLLGVLKPDDDEFDAYRFRDAATMAIDSIANRGRTPIIVGGSNSYIEKLVDDDDFLFRSRYQCCFLWVDVNIDLLHSMVNERVDRMVENGLVEEVRAVFDSRNSDYSKGIRKAIGVPELDFYFRAGPYVNKFEREKMLREAVRNIKRNTCKLASRQRQNIERLINVKKWVIYRLDATEVLLNGGDDAWDRFVAGPGMEIMENFLISNKNNNYLNMQLPTNTGTVRDNNNNKRSAHCLVG